MTTKSLAHPAPATLEKPHLRCAACDESAGSISAGTGRPVVRDRATGLWFHVRCRPGSPSGTAAVLLADAV